MFQIAMKCPPIKPSGHCSWHIGNLTWQSNFLFLSQNFVTLNGPSTHYINDNVGWGFILQELDWDNFTSGHSVLLSSVAVEKLGSGEDQCSDHGPQSGNHLVRGYQHEDNQIIFFLQRIGEETEEEDAGWLSRYQFKESQLLDLQIFLLWVLVPAQYNW